MSSIASESRAASARCAAAYPDSPMPGTAEAVDVWIMLEERGSWPARAIAEGQLPAALIDWIDNQVAALQQAGLTARPQLIRQESRDPAGRRLMLGSAGRLFASAGLTDADIVKLDLATLQNDLAANARGKGIAGWYPVTRPHFFVCTNGRRDQCCARLGLPVYRRLRDLVQERAWRTTHVGGHRFATNVLTLGDSAVYGRVTPADCDALVAQVDGGELAFPWLRGRSRYPQHVQAAEALLAEQNLKLLHVAGDDRSAVVEFAGARGRYRIALQRATTAQMILAGCDKTALKAVYPFERV